MYKTIEDKYYIAKTEMEEKLIALLAGRAAEKIALNDISTGASNDIQMATEIAKDMVIKYGMSDEFGPIFINEDPYEKQILGDDINNIVGAEIKKIINTAYKKAQNIILKNRDKLDEVAEALIKKEIISSKEFESFFK